MKGKLDGDAMTKFAMNHVEKLVLGLMIGLFVFLIYGGLSIESFSSSKSPDDLTQTATNVMSDLETDHWAAIQDEELRKIRGDEDPTFEQLVGYSRAPIDAGLKFDVRGVPPLKARTKRRAPAIESPDYAPQQVQVAAVLGALNIQAPPRAVSPFSKLEDAPAIELVVEEKRPPRRSGRRPPRGAFGEMGSEMMDMESQPMDTTMMDESSGMDGTARKLNPKYNLGSGPKEGLMGGGSEMGGSATDVTVPVTYQFIAGTAVMPNEALFAEFEEALAKASAYNPARDRPVYIAFRVIRADVTGRTVDQLEVPDNEKIESGKSEWVVTTSNAFINAQYVRKWALPLPGEVIAPPFYDRVLTLPIPPILMRNYLPFISHGAVPFIWDKRKPDGNVAAADEPEVVNLNSGSLLDINDLKNAASAASSMDGGEGYESEYGSEYGSDTYGGSYGSTEMGSEYGEGSTIVVPSAEFKMIRFYDFRDSRKVNPNAPQPDREYVYCISVAIGDPNYPLDARLMPPLKTMDDDTLAMVQKKMADDLATSKKIGRAYRKGYEWSAWSKPSAPVSLPGRQWFAGGGTYPPELSTMQGKTFMKTEPTADVVAVNWDWRYATELTADFEKAKLGTVLDKDVYADHIVDPSTLEIKLLEGAKVKTGGVLVGIAGSHPLGILGDDGEPIPAPGATLIVNDDGSLSVHGEVEDAFKHRQYTFADEREALEKAQAAAAATNTMEGEMMDMESEFSFE